MLFTGTKCGSVHIKWQSCIVTLYWMHIGIQVAFRVVIIVSAEPTRTVASLRVDLDWLSASRGRPEELHCPYAAGGSISPRAGADDATTGYWVSTNEPGRCGSKEPCVPEHPFVTLPHDQRGLRQWVDCRPVVTANSSFQMNCCIWHLCMWLLSDNHEFCSGHCKALANTTVQNKIEIAFKYIKAFAVLYFSMSYKITLSALVLLVGWTTQEGHPAYKKSFSKNSQKFTCLTWKKRPVKQKLKVKHQQTHGKTLQEDLWWVKQSTGICAKIYFYIWHYSILHCLLFLTLLIFKL